VKEFSFNSDAVEGLEIVSAILTTASNKRLLFSSCFDHLTLSALGWENLTIFWITLVISLRTL
jgi:hypothetical protein